MGRSREARGSKTSRAVGSFPGQESKPGERELRSMAPWLGRNSASAVILGPLDSGSVGFWIDRGHTGVTSAACRDPGSWDDDPAIAFSDKRPGLGLHRSRHHYGISPGCVAARVRWALKMTDSARLLRPPSWNLHVAKKALPIEMTGWGRLLGPPPPRHLPMAQRVDSVFCRR